MRHAFQRCFRTVLEVLEVDVYELRRVRARERRERRAAGPVLIPDDWLVTGQMDFWPEDRPPPGRPRSYFARKPLSRAEQAFGKLCVDDPKVRLPIFPDCVSQEGPCVAVRCRHHLAIETNDIGSLKVNFPAWNPTDLVETCSIRVARRGPQTIETVARLLNISTERVRQITLEAQRKARRGIDPDRLLRGPRPA